MICGIDEAGRGPLAGPVYAAAVIFGDDVPAELIAHLNDSKKLSPKKRAEAEKAIREHAMFGIGWASHEEIDAINILNASLLAMRRAFEAIPPDQRVLATEVIVDGLYTPKLDAPLLAAGSIVRALVKADALVPQVMAASILAKEERDRRMAAYALEFPQYGYERHKGYPTKLHCELIARYGASPIQRKTFTVPDGI
jgi:ribonuclease HII